MLGRFTESHSARIAATGALDDLCGQNRFARGRKPRVGERAFGALRFRIERLERQDEIAVELRAHGCVELRRPHVENAAAHRERAGVFDDRRTQIAAGGETGDDALEIDRFLRRDALGGRRTAFDGTTRRTSAVAGTTRKRQGNRWPR